MSIISWFKNLWVISPAAIKKKSSSFMAKEADVRSPRKWLQELYGKSLEPTKASQFIHAEKKKPVQSVTQGDHDLSKILEEALENPTKKQNS